ncbi:MAG: metallopeptidase family protein [Desulfobacteraceae bacterium]|jgi:predicted Zn-dependent protease with MMP-like domain
MRTESSKLSPSAFDRIVKRAVDRIPGEIRKGLDNVLISVQPRPSAELLDEMGLPPDELLLGVYQGTPLGDRSVAEPPLYPDVIVLFQEPLETICETVEEMEREIEITVVHEVAHFLGMDEERLAELGYG